MAGYFWCCYNLDYEIIRVEPAILNLKTSICLGSVNKWNHGHIIRHFPFLLSRILIRVTEWQQVLKIYYRSLILQSFFHMLTPTLIVCTKQIWHKHYGLSNKLYRLNYYLSAHKYSFTVLSFKICSEYFLWFINS